MPLRLAFTICICTIFLSAATSQTKQLQTSEKGLQTPKFILGGSFAISNRSVINENIFMSGPTVTFTSISETDQFFFNFNPYFAAQINGTDMVGLELGYRRGSSRIKAETFLSENTNNGFGIGLFYRKYIYAWKSFSLFVQPSAFFEHSIGKMEQSAPAQVDTKANEFNAGIDLNVSYTINKWSLFAGIIGANFLHNKSRNALQEFSTTTNLFSLSTAFTNFNFGIERRF